MSQSSTVLVSVPVRPSVLQRVSGWLKEAVDELEAANQQTPSSLQVRDCLKSIRSPLAAISLATPRAPREAVIGRVETVLSNLKGLPREVTTLLEKSGTTVRSILDSTMQASSSYANGEVKIAKQLFAKVDSSLMRVTEDVVATLATAERNSVSAVALESLEAIGYVRIETGEASGVTGIAAHHPDGHVVAVAVHDGGEVTTEHAGFSGTACLPWVQKLYGEMSRRGAQLSTSQSNTHGDPKGGQLLRAAALNRRSQGGTLAQAVAEVSVRPQTLANGSSSKGHANPRVAIVTGPVRR